MPQLSADRWRALSPYLDHALDITPEERAAWLGSIREQNPTLATELQTLLNEHHALGDEGFLKTGTGALPRPAPLAGQTIGAYTLESPIGQGGMGTVWVARRSDGRFQGRAAVKFLNIAHLGGAGDERFKREGNILARLAHPNIAHLIDAGVSATGQPYLVLEYVEGSHIDRYCNAHALDVEARTRLFLEVLAAVAHAHANLIVHRDIKPSNVLVTNDGQVKLLDFGIAKLLEDEAPAAAATVLTRQGERALTLAYAAPEQVTGSSITTGTDIYALGILLYLLLTGKHPAESALQSPADLIKAIVDTEPARPSDITASSDKLRRALRGDLDTIVAKALKKNPAERYVSATALADDLRRYLKHEPIGARPDTLAYRAKKFVRRNRISVVLAAAVLTATAAGVVATIIQARTARMERDFALRQLSRAEAIEALNTFVLSDAAPSKRPFTVNDQLAGAEELVAKQKGPPTAIRAELLLHIGEQYLALTQYPKAHQVLTQAYTLARALPEQSTRALTSCALAQALSNQGDLLGAEKLIDQGLKEIPDDARFALERVYCLQRGSGVALIRGYPHDAISRAQAAQRALAQSPLRSGSRELDNLGLLAGAYQHAGKVREANAAFEKASARLAEVGRGETERARVLFNNWGLALLSWGRPLESERMLGRTMSLGQDKADANPAVFVNYARSLAELGRLDEAAVYAERGYAKAQAMGNRQGISESLLERAVIYRTQGNLDRATEMLSELEPTLRRDYPAGHIIFGDLAVERALVGRGRGEAQAALDLANQAVAIAEASLKERRAGAGFLQTYLLSRSEIHQQLGHKDEAEADARRSLKILLDKAQPGTLSSKLGRAYLVLGRALQAQGKREEATAAFRSAVEHLQSALGPDHAETQSARQLAKAEIP